MLENAYDSDVGFVNHDIEIEEDEVPFKDDFSYTNEEKYEFFNAVDSDPCPENPNDPDFLLNLYAVTIPNSPDSTSDLTVISTRQTLAKIEEEEAEDIEEISMLKFEKSMVKITKK